MKKIILFSAMLLYTIIICEQVWAHKLNIFAYREAENIRVKAYFSLKSPCRGSSVTAKDAAGKIIWQGSTDAKGEASFPAIAGEVFVKVDTGTGHAGKAKVAANEKNTLPGDIAAVTSNSEPAASADPYSKRELELIRRDVESIRADLNSLRADTDEPSLRNIIGGLGWIIGLFGVGAFFASRNRNRKTNDN